MDLPNNKKDIIYNILKVSGTGLRKSKHTLPHECQLPLSSEISYDFKTDGQHK